jgi:hypothetical protein
LVGLVLSFTQILGVGRDYLNYVEFFDLVRSIGSDVFLESRFEPGFSLLTMLIATGIDSNLLVYSFFVMIALLLKGWVISAHSANQKIFLVVAAFYLIRYLPLHELTQLRIALGIAFVLLGAMMFWRGELFLGTLVCVFAMLFHMSVVAILPGLFLSATKRRNVILIGAIVFIATFFVAGILTNYLSGYIQILNAYESDGSFNDSSPNPFAVYLLIDLAMVFFSLFMWEKLSTLMQRIVALQIVGLAIFYGAFDFSVIAIRVRELYSVFWVIFVALGLRRKGMVLVTYGFVSACAVFYLYLYVFYQEIPFFNAA